MFYFLQIMRRSLFADHPVIHPQPITLCFSPISPKIHEERLNSHLSSNSLKFKFITFVFESFRLKSTSFRSQTVFNFYFNVSNNENLSFSSQNVHSRHPGISPRLSCVLCSLFLSTTSNSSSQSRQSLLTTRRSLS